MLRSPSGLLTAGEFPSLLSVLPTIWSEPPLFSTSALLVLSCRRRLCEAAERSTSTPESESEPPAPTEANATSVLTSIFARLERALGR